MGVKINGKKKKERHQKETRLNRFKKKEMEHISRIIEKSISSKNELANMGIGTLSELFLRGTLSGCWL